MNDKSTKSKKYFSALDYPKSFGSIKKGDFRLKSFLNLNNKNIRSVEKDLRKFCIERAKMVKPIIAYNGLKYINSGWEWSVFKKNNKVVVKIPAGIFSEVNNLTYLENTKEAYEVIKKVFPSKFIAKSKFYRKDGLNIQEQEFIKGKTDVTINYKIKNKKLLADLNKFLECSLNIAEKYEWLPDFRFLKRKSGFLLRNVIFEDATNRPVIIDFTLYFDPNRLCPKMTKACLYRQKIRIIELINELKKQS